MKPYYKLNFPVNKFILDPIQVTEFPESFKELKDGNRSVWRVMYAPEKLVLEAQFIEFLNSIGIRNTEYKEGQLINPKNVMLLKGHGHSTVVNVHRDSPGVPTTCWGINFGWGSLKNEMQWFDLKPGAVAVRVPTLTNKIVDSYSLDSIVMTDSIPLTLQPTLCRVDIPHSGINYGITDIWACSLRDNKDWIWEQAVDFFSEWIVNDETMV